MKKESKKLILKNESSEFVKPGFELSALHFRYRIGYDGKRAANNLTGLGNYSRSLIEHLAIQFPDNLYYIYTPKIKAAIRAFGMFAKQNIQLVLAPKGENKLFWRSSGIKKQLLIDQIDLFHGLSHEIPLGIQKTKIKSIVTIHDLIFLLKPQYYKLIDRFIYKLKSKYACQHADRIIAISEQTKKDIVVQYQIDPSKIDVVYQSCDDSFKMTVTADDKEKVRLKYQLPEKYLLNVGTIEPRKNLLLLIKALPNVNTTYPLVVVGKETAYVELVKQEIEKLGLQHRVLFLKHIPFNDLPAVYQMASLFIYPSHYEGFGIPVIEALYGEVPVIAATGSCLEEAGGPDSIYVSPNQSDELTQAINNVLNNEDLQQTMKQKGLAYVQRFNHDVVSRQLMDCYKKTLDI